MNSLYRATVLALYQLTVILGVVLLPVAFVARRAGVPFPFERVIRRLDDAVEASQG
jgi:hypothetical protein